MPSWFGLFRDRSPVSSSYTVLVRDLHTVVYEGEAKAISSFNELGPFDILPGHAFFISLIRNKVTIHRDEKDTLEFPLEQGILRLKENRVTIFMGLEVLDTSTQPENASTT